MSKRFEHDHLHRLRRVWVDHPVYLITCATDHRRRVLAQPAVHDILVEVWKLAPQLYGWCVGSYVLMPDHVHFFCAVTHQRAVSLSRFCGKWKEWTSKHFRNRLGIDHALWQAGFHDWLIRSEQDFRDKLDYVTLNPVRQGLVAQAEDWPYRGRLHSL